MLLYGKMLSISNYFSSEATGPVLLKFHVEPPWDRGMKVCLNIRGPLTKMAGKNLY